MTGLRGRASIAGAALITAAGLAISTAPAALTAPAATALTAPATAAQPTAPASGVDVSANTTFTDSTPWLDLQQAGNSFVGIKATEGNYYKNDGYVQDVTDATAAGLFVMPYVFANPYHTNGTAAEQADYAWNNEIGTATSPAYLTSNLMLPLVLDIEPDPYVAKEKNSNQCYGLGQLAMVQWIQQFLTEAQAKTQKTPIIYTTAAWWSACTGNSGAFGGYPLWIASYGVSSPALPSGWNNYTFWQYTNIGTVPGIKGSQTDQDFLGPVLQVSPVGKPIALVQLQTLTSLNGQQVSYTPATLLPGVSVNAAGRITGTPSTIGQYAVTVTPSAGAVPSTMPFTWDVHGTITVNSPGTRTTIVGAPVGLRISASDPDPGYAPSFAATGLPAGLSINPAGLITGWPSKPGAFKVTVTASDGLGGTGSMSFAWTIRAAGNSGVTGPIRQAGGTGKCLDDPGSKTVNGARVDLWTCTGRANQSWTVVQDGTIRVLGKCLAVAGEGRANGTKLQLWTCNPGDGGQRWQAGTDGELVNPQSGKCLDDPVSSAANGTQPVLWTCANLATQPNEHWLRPAAGVYSGEPGKCLAVAPGSVVVVAACANTAAQHWTTQPDGTVRLGGKCLTEAGAAASSGLLIGPCAGTAATKWKLAAVGPIAIELAGAAPGLCVTAPASGTAVVLGACAATPAATWHVA